MRGKKCETWEGKDRNHLPRYLWYLNLCFSPNICDANLVSGTIHLLDEYFLNTYYKPGTVPETEDIMMNSIDDAFTV